MHNPHLFTQYWTLQVSLSLHNSVEYFNDNVLICILLVGIIGGYCWALRCSLLESFRYCWQTLSGQPAAFPSLTQSSFLFSACPHSSILPSCPGHHQSTLCLCTILPVRTLHLNWFICCGIFCHWHLSLHHVLSLVWLVATFLSLIWHLDLQLGLWILVKWWQYYEWVFYSLLGEMFTMLSSMA